MVHFIPGKLTEGQKKNEEKKGPQMILFSLHLDRFLLSPIVVLLLCALFFTFISIFLHEISVA
ncbi:hypothetical protein BDV34DRAFT_201032 [Aspergillus parasiticus]|uniref:Uncharacterized protein n=1 Tax=Aspergillus parasiticus TaxID=5067 RepID=A0A5N6DB29_ASPPA|nr:hypothetical protein BDV34DRAFT_201032 [Aspergillus parasiticus]